MLLLSFGHYPHDARAQAIQLQADGQALAVALDQFRLQTGLDLVFSQNLVRGKSVRCQYVGDDAAEALRCLLGDTGLVAQRVAPRRYIISAKEVLPPPVRRSVLAGFVVDEETNELLPGAHVYLPARRTGTTTNDGGYFALPEIPHQQHRVRISYLGYTTLDTLLTVPTGRVTLRMEPVALRTGTVVVEATATSRADLTRLPGASHLPVQKMAQLPTSLGGHDVLEALQWLPGVQRAGEVTGGLVVRGTGPDQNLYLIDGAPVYHPWHAFSFISTFQTETFKNVRLYRGAFPAEHGGRLSAVVDAELRDGSNTQPRAVLGLNTLNARMLIESPITSNSSFMLSWRRSFIDQLVGRQHPVEDDSGRRDTLRTGYYFYDWSAKVTFRPTPRSRLSASLYNGRDDLDLRLPFDLSLDFSSWLRPADLFFEVGQNWGNRLVSVRYQYLFARRFFVTITGYNSRYEAREGTFIQPTTRSSVASAYRVRVRDLGLRADAEFYGSLAHNVRVGMQVVGRDFLSDLDATIQHAPGIADVQQDRSREDGLEVVGYLEDTWKPRPAWEITPGVRLSYFQNGNYVRLMPRLSVQYAIDPMWLVVRG